MNELSDPNDIVTHRAKLKRKAKDLRTQEHLDIVLARFPAAIRAEVYEEVKALLPFKSEAPS